MPQLEHEKLDVYRAAIQFIRMAYETAENLPRGNGHLGDQLRRAAISIPLNIAEGAGEFSPADKARFYRMALRSSTECAAILDVCRALGMQDEPARLERERPPRANRVHAHPAGQGAGEDHQRERERERERERKTLAIGLSDRHCA